MKPYAWTVQKVAAVSCTREHPDKTIRVDRSKGSPYQTTVSQTLEQSKSSSCWYHPVMCIGGCWWQLRLGVNLPLSASGPSMQRRLPPVTSSVLSGRSHGISGVFREAFVAFRVFSECCTAASGALGASCDEDGARECSRIGCPGQ